MVKRIFSAGKIYKIEPIIEHDDGDVYIGATTKEYLSQRMATHKSNYKSWINGKGHNIMVYKLFEKFGFDNCKIILLETYPCSSIDELNKQKASHIRLMPNVNKVIPGRTTLEYKQDNKEKIKQYKEDTKDHIKEYSKQYREENYDKIKIYKALKCKCELCGGFYTTAHKGRHFKSTKHLENIKPITEEI
ncbi:hypothetical protein B484DRAFT_341369 [Ochromonadaceae sp. CCMP2298]|nr:hypothetical protein B484DRAFT_341369 [Ochromonadaceae sp. CCMP2298]